MRRKQSCADKRQLPSLQRAVDQVLCSVALSLSQKQKRQTGNRIMLPLMRLAKSILSASKVTHAHFDLTNLIKGCARHVYEGPRIATHLVCFALCFLQRSA